MSDFDVGETFAVLTLGCLGVVGLLLFVALIATIPVWFVWNNVIVDLAPSLHHCTLLQAFGLSIFLGFIGKSHECKKS